MPYSAPSLPPVKKRSMPMFTTPATAPEPQAADAPPVTTSTLFTRTDGMLLRSFSLDTRRPSIRTSVRLIPRPRRSTGALPAPVLVPVVWGELLALN